jgi:single-strand DNA-binding protein
MNQLSIYGNLTRDPEFKEFDGGQLANFGIASNETFYTKGGEKKEKVAYVDCVAWGGLAIVVRDYLRKGRPVMLWGSLATDSWEDSEGNKRSKLELSVNKLKLVGSRQEQPEPEQITSGTAVDDWEDI